MSLNPDRRCLTCLQELPAGKFLKDSSVRDGLSTSCKHCLCNATAIVQAQPRYRPATGPLVPARTGPMAGIYKPQEPVLRNLGTAHIPSKGAFE